MHGLFKPANRGSRRHLNFVMFQTGLSYGEIGNLGPSAVLHVALDSVHKPENAMKRKMIQRSAKDPRKEWSHATQNLVTFIDLHWNFKRLVVLDIWQLFHLRYLTWQ